MAVLNNHGEGKEAEKTTDVRVHTASTKLTRAELNGFNALAESRNMRGSDLLRNFILRELAVDKSPDSADPIFTEIVGLRLFIMYALGPIYCGEEGTREAFDALVKGVKQQKRKVAGELAQRYRDERAD